MTIIPLSLYIHIPWCVRKCPYCDFNSHQMPDAIPEKEYLAALLSDLESELPYIWGRPIESIFIGGGTPSLFSAGAIDSLLSGLRERLPLRPSIEITLEANPGTFEQARFQAYREAGINRLSIGIQSYNPQHLKALGRIHNTEEAIQAAAIAKQAGFDNFNLDLMHGLPQQTLVQAMQDLQQAISLQPTHISWYQLTIEKNTLFHHSPPVLPDDERLWQIQQQGQTLLADSGFSQYEVSAYAQKNRQCIHNINYWQFGDYVGIGAGAHGKITQPDNTITRHQKYRQPAKYIEQARQGNARSATTTLQDKDRIFEFMLNTLRLKQGFNKALFERRTGLAFNDIAANIEQAINKGLLHKTTSAKDTSDNYSASKQGWHFLNDLIEIFL